MPDYQDCLEYKYGISHIRAAARKLGVFVGSPREEVGDAGLARLHAMLLELIEKVPRTDAEYDAYFRDLLGVAGIFALITTVSTTQTTFSWMFHNIAEDLTSSAPALQSIPHRRAMTTQCEHAAKSPRTIDEGIISIPPSLVSELKTYHKAQAVPYQDGGVATKTQKTPAKADAKRRPASREASILFSW